MEKPIPAYWYDKATAVFVKRDDPTIANAIMPSVFSPVGYVHHFQNGRANGTTDASHISFSITEEYFECIKSPVGDLYHAWHICICDKCSRVVHDAIFGDSRIGGRIFDHSQAAWDEHLRYVDYGQVFTYNTVK